MGLSENSIDHYRDALVLVQEANNNYSISIKRLFQAVQSIEHEPTQTKCQRLLAMAMNGTEGIERILNQKEILLSSGPYLQQNPTPLSTK